MINCKRKSRKLKLFALGAMKMSEIFMKRTWHSGKFGKLWDERDAAFRGK
jgi:hypothetical protein